jgi:hypothetical protein
MAQCPIAHIREIPIVFTNRTHGSSKLKAGVMVQYLVQLARLYRTRYPLAVYITLIALLSAAVAIAVRIVKAQRLGALKRMSL